MSSALPAASRAPGLRALLSAVCLLACACSGRPSGDGPASARNGLVDLTSCGASNLAMNLSQSGFPSPLESDPGITGDPWDLVDGVTQYPASDRGVHFDLGGSHQITIDFGTAVTLDGATLWHHPDGGIPGHNIPGETLLEYFDGTTWVFVDAARSVNLQQCGDGVLHFLEQCDDGNSDDTDSCTNACRWNICGDGIPYLAATDPGHPRFGEAGSGLEQCDDANGDDTDSCINACRWNVCGDGAVYTTFSDPAHPAGAAGLEQCDDANLDDTDACVSGCQTAACGDGFLHSAIEVCDDGNTVPDDGCGITAASCAVQNPRAFENQACSCLLNSCGNGVRDDPEECDDGNNLDSDSCTNSCVLARCGDGIVQPAGPNGLLGDSDDESCDDANSEATDSCTNACQWNTCGDGAQYATVTNPANPSSLEECDDGNGVDDDACSNACILNVREARIDPVETAFAELAPPSSAYPDAYSFSPISGTKLRWSFNGDGPNIAGGPSQALQVALGGQHSCALRSTGKVACWGLGVYGRLGNGSTQVAPFAVAVSGLSNAVDVAAGGEHTCAVLATGQVACWGAGGQGRLGNGALGIQTTPVLVSGLADATSVAAGDAHTCALRSTGEVVCWGAGSFGVLGNGTTASSSVPVAVFGLADAVEIAAGDQHTCARRSTGEVACWGAGSFGRLGNGSTAISTVPVPVAGLSDAIGIAAGFAHSCAVRATGSVACWGLGTYGQLGDGGTSISAVPVSVVGLGDAVQVSTAGGILFGGASSTGLATCAVRATGQVACWGTNAYGMLGDGTAANSLVPVTVTGLSDAVHVELGGQHACAARSTGQVSCWGAGGYGQLGDGSQLYSWVPRDVLGFGSAPWQAWLHEVSVHGCVEPAGPESISATLPAGGSLTTDSEGDGATPQDPIETTVTTPNAGSVSIDEAPLAGGPPQGFVILGQQVTLSAPSASIPNPLLLVFILDGSLLPAGTDADDVVVLRNGVPAGACVAPPAAIPNPCVESRFTTGDDVVLTVRTSAASVWTFGIAIPSDRDGDGVLDGFDGCPDDAAKQGPGVCGCGFADADSDADGALDCEDPCPNDPSDACDDPEPEDEDGDGVEDDRDACPGTLPHTIVNGRGCSIEQECPCTGPDGPGSSWRNHGQYVSCVTHAAHRLRLDHLIDARDECRLVPDAARSNCGKDPPRGRGR